MNTPLLMLRAFQVGMSLEDISCMNVGEIIDILIEQGNDNFKYPYKATQEDYRAFFGG